MRQQKPPAGTVFLLCLNCDRGEFRRPGEGQVETPCRHCGGTTEQRYPLTLALTESDRGLLKAISEWMHTKPEDAATNALRHQFRRAATDRAHKGKSLPPWAVEWLQTNKEQ